MVRPLKEVLEEREGQIEVIKDLLKAYLANNMRWTLQERVAWDLAIETWIEDAEDGEEPASGAWQGDN